MLSVLVTEGLTKRKARLSGINRSTSRFTLPAVDSSTWAYAPPALFNSVTAEEPLRVPSIDSKVSETPK